MNIDIDIDYLNCFLINISINQCLSTYLPIYQETKSEKCKYMYVQIYEKVELEK